MKLWLWIGGLLALTACSEEEKSNEPATEPSNEVVDTDGDGVIDSEDAFPSDPNESVDSDEDGVGANADCDDEDDSIGSIANDADCDGVLTIDDCDDNDTSSTVLATDADCDGVITNEDCDDTTPTLGSNLVDTDCDGITDVFEICGDGIDNDYNGLMDCEDAQCFSDPTCFETCADGIDNDLDGLTDCDDDECWGTGSCTSGYTLIQQGSGYITSYGNGFNINSSCTVSQFSPHCIQEITLRATNFVGELRIPTGPDTFQQCLWTTNASASMYSSVQFTYQVLSNGTTTTGWVTNTDSQFYQRPLTRRNMTVDANCPFTTSSMISQFLGTTWRRSYYQGVYMPQHNQWVDWYKPGSILGSPSCPSCTSMYNVEVGHKLDF